MPQVYVDAPQYDDTIQRYGRWLVDVLNWKNQPVLDVGCGTGLRTAAFAESGAVSVGVDRDEAAVHLGRQHWPVDAERGSTEGLPTGSSEPPLLVASALDLHQFGDNRFAGLHAYAALEHSRSSQIPLMLQELYRVAQPGALFFCVIQTKEHLSRAGVEGFGRAASPPLVRSYDWWRAQFESQGWSICTEEFRLLLLAHGWCPFRQYDWDWFVFRKQEQYRVTSKLCVRDDFDHPSHNEWTTRLRLSGKLLRKEWEFVQLASAIEERGLLLPGRKGIGFGVGKESLTASFAAAGCQVLATDIPSEKWDTLQWEETLNEKSICPPAEFSKNVSTRFLDMNQIPSDLEGFDFAWSACSLDHLGTIWMSERFIFQSLNCVKPGGWCFHTAEYSLDRRRAPSTGGTVYFTCESLERLIAQLGAMGHHVEPMNWNLGSRREDNFVDDYPWTGPHLKLIGDGVVATSVLLVIQRGTTPAIQLPPDEVTARTVLDSWIPMRPE